MRKVILLTFLLTLVPATQAKADEGVITDHLASVSNFDVVWENGSRGDVFVRVVGSSRAASVKGEFTVDGMPIPGGDLDLGTSVLSEERYFGP